jgi:hypothetical protein
MAGKIFISETGLSTDKTSSKASILGASNQKFNVELSWGNATGTLDGTVDLNYATTAAATPANNAAEQFVISEASGTHQFFIDPHHLRFLQAVYTKNGITSIDIIISSSDMLGELQ